MEKEIPIEVVGFDAMDGRSFILYFSDGTSLRTATR
jgi:hypothetical protein